MMWAYSKLDPEKSTSENIQSALEEKVSDEWIVDILDTHVGRHDPESRVIQTGNTAMDNVNWIGDILGSTVDFFSDFDTT